MTLAQLTRPEPKLRGPDETKLSVLQSGVVACLLDGMSAVNACKALGITGSKLESVRYMLRQKFGVRTDLQLMVEIGKMLAADEMRSSAFRRTMEA